MSVPPRLRLGAALLVLLAVPHYCGAYVFMDPFSVWPAGTIGMALQFESPGRQLLDGSTSWAGLAESALGAWNQSLPNVQFIVISDTPGAHGDNDGVNQVYFDSSIYGLAFGPDALAVTTRWQAGSRRVEGDTVFNSAKAWDSYRGPIRTTPQGQPIFDFYRVALHEFGHTLGLDHPDQQGQTVPAIMNSAASEVDSLTDDDRSGALALYSVEHPVEEPLITRQPESKIVAVGAPVAFVPAVSGAAPLDYQWFRNGVPIGGATNGVYQIASARPGDRGAYKLRVKNSAGTAFSSNAVLQVMSGGAVSTVAVSLFPTSQVAVVNGSATVSATVAGADPVAFQWLFRNRKLIAQTNSVLALSNLQMAARGTYRLEVSTVLGIARSGVATLNVVSPPVILTRERQLSAQAGQRLVMRAVAKGSKPFTYQWFKDGAAIGQATNRWYIIPGAQPDSSGVYSVRVSNPGASAEAAILDLTLVP